MSNFPPEIEEFVEELVFSFLDSLRTSKQVESRYHDLTQTAKAATTRELRELSSSAATNLLDNIDDIDDLAHLDSNKLVREALIRALPDRD